MPGVYASLIPATFSSTVLVFTASLTTIARLAPMKGTVKSVRIGFLKSSGVIRSMYTILTRLEHTIWLSWTAWTRHTTPIIWTASSILLHCLGLLSLCITARDKILSGSFLTKLCSLFWFPRTLKPDSRLVNKFSFRGELYTFLFQQFEFQGLVDTAWCFFPIAFESPNISIWGNYSVAWHFRREGIVAKRAAYGSWWRWQCFRQDAIGRNLAGGYLFKVRVDTLDISSVCSDGCRLKSAVPLETQLQPSMGWRYSSVFHSMKPRRSRMRGLHFLHFYNVFNVFIQKVSHISPCDWPALLLLLL